MEYTGFWHQVNKLTNYEMLKGNSLDIQNLADVAELRADMQVERVMGNNIWGILRDCQHNPLGQHTVKLISACKDNNGEYFKVIACTQTDDNGFYRFDAYSRDENQYNIIVEDTQHIPILLEQSSCCEESHKTQGISEQPVDFIDPILEPVPIKEKRTDQPPISHKMNVYHYKYGDGETRGFVNTQEVKFYGNNTYPYGMK